MSDQDAHSDASRIERLEADVRSALLGLSAIAGVDGRGGKIADIVGDQSAMAREFFELRQTRVRTFVALASFVAAAIGAGFWAGVVTTDLRNRVDRVDRALHQYIESYIESHKDNTP